MTPLSETTVVQKLAKTREGEPVHPVALRKAERNLVRVLVGVPVALTAMVLAIIVTMKSGLSVMLVAFVGLCFAAGLFAANVMDSATLLELARIVLRREKT